VEYFLKTLLHGEIYTVSQKTSMHIFVHVFTKYSPIIKISSLLHLAVNLQ